VFLCNVPEVEYDSSVIEGNFPEISVVVPCYNEEECLEASVEVIKNELQSISESWELILVNDGSTDKTQEICKKLLVSNRQIRILELSRNFGHMAAITAGYKEAKGDCVVTIDADLQDPPHVIKELYRIWKTENCDFIQAVRSDRSSDAYIKRVSASIFYTAARRTTGIKIESHSGDFRLISRRVVDILNSLPEKNKVYRLLIPWLGFKQKNVYYTRDKRIAGVSKYDLRKMINLAIDSFLSFSSKPLRILSHISIVATGVFILAAILSVWLHFLVSTIPGWTSIVFLILASNSLVLGGIAIIGEYVAKMYEILLNRPNVIYNEVTK
jgi:glycosyltransferase involved in cell wall biosynthesis